MPLRATGSLLNHGSPGSCLDQTVAMVLGSMPRSSPVPLMAKIFPAS